MSRSSRMSERRGLKPATVKARLWTESGEGPRLVLARLAVDDAVGEAAALVFGALQGGVQAYREARRQRQRRAEAGPGPAVAPVFGVGAGPVPAGMAVDSAGSAERPIRPPAGHSPPGRRDGCSRGSCAGRRWRGRTGRGAVSGGARLPGAGRSGRSPACRRSIAGPRSPAGSLPSSRRSAGAGRDAPRGNGGRNPRPCSRGCWHWPRSAAARQSAKADTGIRRRPRPRRRGRISVWKAGRG